MERYLDNNIRGMSVEQGKELIEIFNRLIQPVFSNTSKKVILMETY